MSLPRLADAAAAVLEHLHGVLPDVARSGWNVSHGGDDDDVAARLLQRRGSARPARCALAASMHVGEVVDRLRQLGWRPARLPAARRTAPGRDEPQTSAGAAEPASAMPRSRRAITSRHGRRRGQLLDGGQIARGRAARGRPRRHVGRMLERQHGAHDAVGDAGRAARPRAWPVHPLSRMDAVQPRDVPQQRRERRRRRAAPARRRARACRAASMKPSRRWSRWLLTCVSQARRRSVARGSRRRRTDRRRDTCACARMISPYSSGNASSDRRNSSLGQDERRGDAAALPAPRQRARTPRGRRASAIATSARQVSGASPSPSTCGP